MASPPPQNPSERVRLDVALVARGLARSRGEAQEMVRAGAIEVDGKLAAKPGQLVGTDDRITANQPVGRYVSRGGLKLEAALAAFQIDPTGTRCLDVGASTGGFTDCLLQHGAAEVVAIDVGHSQLHPRLAADSRVRSYEGVNARELNSSEIEGPFTLIVMDLSFISATLVLPAIVPLLSHTGKLVVLVKPQFEVGRTGLGKRGVVKSDADRGKAVERVTAAAAELGMILLGVIESPIAGGEGNIEYLASFTKPTPQ